MAYEIEIKAHVDAGCVEAVRTALQSIPGIVRLGDIDKNDVYWANPGSEEPLFRTRQETTADGPDVLFTAKPDKSKSPTGTEENMELEFGSSADQWDRIQEFCAGIGLVIWGIKCKKGCHYSLDIDGYHVHLELLDVKYLGWFLEMEICPESLEGFDVNGADTVLRKILGLAGIAETAIEPMGYNRMLRAIGCNGV